MMPFRNSVTERSVNAECFWSLYKNTFDPSTQRAEADLCESKASLVHVVNFSLGRTTFILRPWLKINKEVNLASPNYQTIQRILNRSLHSPFSTTPSTQAEITDHLDNQQRGIVTFLCLLLNHHRIIYRVLKKIYKIVLTLPKLSLKNTANHQQRQLYPMM